MARKKVVKKKPTISLRQLNASLYDQLDSIAEAINYVVRDVETSKRNSFGAQAEMTNLSNMMLSEIRAIRTRIELIETRRLNAKDFGKGSENVVQKSRA